LLLFNCGYYFNEYNVVNCIDYEKYSALRSAIL
jgi:hypothetical protein